MKNKNFRIGLIILIIVVLLAAILFFLYFRDNYSVSGEAIRQGNSLARISSVVECPAPHFTGITRCNGDYVEGDYLNCVPVSTGSCSCSPVWVAVDYCGTGLVCNSGECIPTNIEIFVSTDREVYSVGDEVYLR